MKTVCRKRSSRRSSRTSMRVAGGTTGRNMSPGSCQPTGVSLSGGGIRSASFCLGALQGLESQTKSGIEGVDYLSTVSGGGYVGCALTAATQKLNGQFPFTSSDPKVYADTPSVRHIRDYSNYLIPHGAWRRDHRACDHGSRPRRQCAHRPADFPVFRWTDAFHSSGCGVAGAAVPAQLECRRCRRRLGQCREVRRFGDFTASGSLPSSQRSASFFFSSGRSPSRLRRRIFGRPGLPGIRPPDTAPN